jgi:glycerol-3-phosphate acyltransferase PlsY
MSPHNLLLALLGYLSGSLMFSVWLTRLRGGDVRTVGDGNPGAFNAFDAGGPLVGSASLLLDFLKGALPVAAALSLGGTEGWWVTPVILAPVLGHVFPVFERFRGGKALSVTFGVWAGVTTWEVPCVIGAAMAIGKLVLRLKEDAMSALLGMIVLVVYVPIRYGSLPLTVAAVLSAAVVIWRHRRELTRR